MLASQLIGLSSGEEYFRRSKWSRKMCLHRWR